MKTVIIADDNKILLEQMKKDLEKHSEIDLLGIANDGIEELNLIKEKQPDIVITDIEMPKMTGIEVIEKTNQLSIKTDFIVVTGAISNIEIIKKITKLNVRSVIYKPFKLEDLIYEILKKDDNINVPFKNNNKRNSITTKIKIFFSKVKKKQL